MGTFCDKCKKLGGASTVDTTAWTPEESTVRFVGALCVKCKNSFVKEFQKLMDRYKLRIQE